MPYNCLFNTVVASLRNASAIAVAAGSAVTDSWKDHYSRLKQYVLSQNNNNNSLTSLTWLPSPREIQTNLVASATEALEHIVYVCLVYLVVCLGIYYVRFVRTSNTVVASVGINLQTENNDDAGGGTNATVDVRIVQEKETVASKNVRLPTWAKQGRVLFVTAHPDDECMFFGPLIYSLTCGSNCQVYLLCLSNGNYEQKSQLRRAELWRSCAELGIPDSNVILVNATNLPDDPNAEWRTEPVANIILHTVESLEIQTLVTFDRDGVSQHPNHCAVYYASASLCLARLLPKDCKLYALDSINVLRKYLSLCDTLCTLCMSTNWCILSLEQASVIRRAMREHHSQMKWFRWLYIYFSRYMFINSVREVTLSDVELEMQIHDH